MSALSDEADIPDPRSNWMTFALDAARLGRETQEVMALRLLKLARGGRAARGFCFCGH
jgi:hypothetical protein